MYTDVARAVTNAVDYDLGVLLGCAHSWQCAGIPYPAGMLSPALLATASLLQACACSKSWRSYCQHGWQAILGKKAIIRQTYFDFDYSVWSVPACFAPTVSVGMEIISADPKV
jgi:hypothetical protein